MRELIKKPLVIIGMMGSGKSTIGKKLARKLGLQFYDSDKVIEEREGLSIMDIYDFMGEKYFQEKEAEIIKEVLNYGVVVLSTGGSSFMNESTRNLIKENAISVWLSADLEILYNRIIKRNTRPELNISDKKKALEEMLKERNPIFSKADITVESKDFDAHHVVDSALVRIKKYLESK